jgi:hydroxyacylglutathione hydrolase
VTLPSRATLGAVTISPHGGTELAVFTGGSLIVGAAARTDLVSPDSTQELARAQYRSLRRLAELPHGAGYPMRMIPRSDPVRGDEQVVEAAFPVGDKERVLDAGGHGGLRPQFPVRNGERGEVDDADRY